MIRKRLYSTAICIVLFSVAWIALHAVVLQAQIRDDGKQKAKPVEQVRKNIQVLKGLPASELNPVMDYIAASLGVRCNHCHVVDSTGWQNEKDDKQTKRTARKMMQMVMDLNAKDFGGRTKVTCYTCHRGSNEPTAIIPLPQKPPPPPSPRGEEARAVPVLPGVEQVLSMYEKALGGADAMKKIKTRVTKGLAVDGQGRELPMEIVQQAPDKFVSSVTVRDGALMMRAYDGRNGWMSSPRGAREMSSEESEDLKRDGLLFPISRIRELSASIHVSGKDTANGAMSYVLTASSGENTTERYYIDTATGLLQRKVVMTETMIADIPEQVDYLDYRSADGVMIPFTVRSASVDPRDSATRRISSVEQNVTLDEKKFAMPQAKK